LRNRKLSREWYLLLSLSKSNNKRYFGITLDIGNGEEGGIDARKAATDRAEAMGIGVKKEEMS